MPVWFTVWGWIWCLLFAPQEMMHPGQKAVFKSHVNLLTNSIFIWSPTLVNLKQEFLLLSLNKLQTPLPELWISASPPEFTGASDHCSPWLFVDMKLFKSFWSKNTPEMFDSHIFCNFYNVLHHAVCSLMFSNKPRRPLVRFKVKHRWLYKLISVGFI